MYQKTIFAISYLLIFVSLISGCSISRPESETMPLINQETILPDESGDHTVAESVTCSMEEWIGDKLLKIDAVVELPEVSDLATVSLAYDAEKLNRLAEIWILTEYPNTSALQTNDGRTWHVEDGESLLRSLSACESGKQAGTVYYLDVERDLNGQELDDNKSLTPHYITEYIPNGMDFTAVTAAKEVSDFLSEHACFTYIPWNITAENCSDSPDTPGCYHMRLQPCLDGRKVYGNGSTRISAFLSPTGIFSLQGCFALKEMMRQPINHFMTLDAAMEQFVSNFSAYAMGDTVFVEDISMSYVSDGNADGVYTLSPAWVFECKDVAEATEKAAGKVRYYYCVFLADSGEFRIEKW